MPITFQDKDIDTLIDALFTRGEILKDDESWCEESNQPYDKEKQQELKDTMRLLIKCEKRAEKISKDKARESVAKILNDLI